MSSCIYCAVSVTTMVSLSSSLAIGIYGRLTCTFIKSNIWSKTTIIARVTTVEVKQLTVGFCADVPN